MSEILIIGNSTVDLLGVPIDSFPAVGELAVFDRFEMASGGCAVNVATALGRLGIACDLVTRIGEDPLGSFLVDELEAAGVGTGRLIIDGEAATGVTFVAIASDGQRSFLHSPGSNQNLQRSDLKDDYLRGVRVVMVAGAMAMRNLDGAQTAEILAAAKRTGATTLLDTVPVEKISRERWLDTLCPALPHVDYFAPSLSEARQLSDRDEPEDVARYLLEMGARNVVLKLGERGALFQSTTGDCGWIPAAPVSHVVDTTGAGDCFCAGLISGLAEGLDLGKATRRANAVAARAIQTLGATCGVPPLQELLADRDLAAG